MLFFARPRLFPREPRRNSIQGITPEQFERHLNEMPPLKVLDGYAPFCKLHRNWTSTRCPAVPITDDNRHLLRSDYEARSKDDLPVLVRWFEGLGRRRRPTSSSSSTAASSWPRRAR